MTGFLLQYSSRNAFVFDTKFIKLFSVFTYFKIYKMTRFFNEVLHLSLLKGFEGGCGSPFKSLKLKKYPT